MEGIVEEDKEEIEVVVTIEVHQDEEEEDLTDLTKISLHALVGITVRETLKIEGYIKKHKVIVLIDSGSTHNFIDKMVVKRLNYFLYPVKNFSIIIANKGAINYGGR